MADDLEKLFHKAEKYSWYLFSGKEIAELCNVGEHQVRRVRNAHDSPFRYNKCRPEWFTLWMQTHPETIDEQTDPPTHVDCGQCSKCASKQRGIKPTRVSKAVTHSHLSRKLLSRKKRP